MNQQNSNNVLSKSNREKVTREENKGYIIESWVISGEAAKETHLKAYTKAHENSKVNTPSVGYLVLNPSDRPELVETFDSVLNTMYEIYGAVDEARPRRNRGDAYEIVVKLSDQDKIVPYDSSFSFNNSKIHLTEKFSPDIISAFDSVYDSASMK